MELLQLLAVVEAGFADELDARGDDEHRKHSHDRPGKEDLPIHLGVRPFKASSPDIEDEA